MGIVVLELELESYISVDQKESSFPKTMTIYISGWDTTGSFRKNGKRKTVFVGTKFHKNLIFSAFFSRELATNLRS